MEIFIAKKNLDLNDEEKFNGKKYVKTSFCNARNEICIHMNPGHTKIISRLYMKIILNCNKKI